MATGGIVKIGQITDFVQNHVVIGQKAKLIKKAAGVLIGYRSRVAVDVQNPPKRECFLYKEGSEMTEFGTFLTDIKSYFLRVVYKANRDTIRYFEKLCKKVNSIYVRDTIRKNKSFCKKVDSITNPIYTIWFIATIFSLNREFELYTRSKKRLK